MTHTPGRDSPELPQAAVPHGASVIRHGDPPERMPAHPGAYPPYGPPPGWAPPVTPRRSRTLPLVLFGIAALMAVVIAVVAGVVLADRKDPEVRANPNDVQGPSAVTISQSELDTLAKAREKALSSGDLKAFLAPLEQSNAQLIAEQTRLFANIGKVPFQVKRYEPVDRQGRSIDRFGRGVTVQFDVAFVHQIKGYDIAPVTEWYRWTVSRKDASSPAVITAVTGAPSAITAVSKTYFYPAPWDLWPDMQVVATDRVMFLTDRAMLDKSRRYAPVAQAAADDVVAAWRAGSKRQNDPIIDRFVVSLLPRRDAMGSLYQISTRDVTEAGFSIGIASADQQSSGPALSGARAVMDASTSFFDAGNTGGATEIFRHEFAHSMLTTLVAEGRGSSGLNQWVVEGFAEYVAHQGQRTAGSRLVDARKAMRQGATVHLPSFFSWGSDLKARGSVISFHYYLGHQAMRYMADEFGGPRVVDFVECHYRGSTVDQCFSTVLGTSKKQFESGWTTFVRNETR